MIAKALCKYFGHQWSVINYSNSIKANGESYKFDKKRICTRCHAQDFFFKEWMPASDVTEEDKDEGFSKYIKMENKKEFK